MRVRIRILLPILGLLLCAAGCKENKAEKRKERRAEKRAEKKQEADTEGRLATAEERCTLWVAALNRGDEGRALLTKLAEKACPGATQALAGRFAASDFRSEILATAQQLGQDSHTEQIVRAALEDPRLITAALELADAWQLAGLDELLSEQLAKANDIQAAALLDTLKERGKPPEVATLIRLLALPPGQVGIGTHQRALQFMIAVDWSSQAPAEAAAAAQAAVLALFRKDAAGSSAQLDARLALRAIGAPAVDAVLSAFAGTNGALNTMMDLEGVPRWRALQGHELVEMLWDIGDARATPTVAKSMGLALDPPPADVALLPEHMRRDWKFANQSRLTTSALTIGALPNNDAIPHLVAILTRENPPPDGTVFAQSALALALIGTPAAREALWKLGNRADGSAVTALAVSLSAKELPDYAAKVTEAAEPGIKDAAAQPLPLGYSAAVNRCKAEASCYVGILQGATSRLESLPDDLEAADQIVRRETNRIREKAKPISQKVKDAGRAYKEKQRAALKLRDEIQAAGKKLEGADNGGLREAYNASVTRFNALFDELTLAEKELDALYKERNEVIDELEPFKQERTNVMAALHQVEKAALMLGTLPRTPESFKALTDVMAQTEDPTHAQLRQWTLISLSRLAQPQDAPAIEALATKLTPNGRVTYYSLSLSALLLRLDRPRGLKWSRANLMRNPTAAIIAHAPSGGGSPGSVPIDRLLSANKMGGIASIMRNDSSGLSNKMAVAMAGAGTEFVMGHGSGGMGFKGTGTGGGGLGGYGRVHGLGQIDTGGGTGMHGSLGRKRAKKVGKVKIGSGTSAGHCKKGDIARAVRRRANSIRACYEQRLQVNPGLSGKVTARWTIGLDGRVKAASAAQNTITDGAVTSCILRVIRRMSFAKPEGGVCVVQWPFVFNPGG